MGIFIWMHVCVCEGEEKPSDVIFLKLLFLLFCTFNRSFALFMFECHRIYYHKDIHTTGSKYNNNHFYFTAFCTFLLEKSEHNVVFWTK